MIDHFTDIVFLKSLAINILLTPYFLASIYCAFYMPGRVLFGKSLLRLTNSPFAIFILSLTLGMVIWAYQGVVLGYLHLRFLTYIYLLIFIILWVKKHRVAFLKKENLFRHIKIDFFIVVIFLLGIFGQNLPFVVGAFNFSDGIRLFSGSADDTFWHTGLIESLTRTFPPIEPGMSGVVVHNYHYWSNMVIAELVRVFKLPLFATQYLFMGILISFLIGSLAYIFGKFVKFGKFGLIVIIYLQYFSSDVIYLLTFIVRHVFIFTIHPLEDGTMFLENTPRAFSFVVLFFGIILIKKWLENFDRKIGLFIVLTFGSLIGFKVHTGAMALFGIGVILLYLLAIRRYKDLYLLASFFISLAIYFPVNAGAGGAIFVPFEMTSRNFVVQNGLGLSWMELARRVYLQYSNYLQVWRMDLTMLAIYIVSQFGIRTVGFLIFKKTIHVLTLPFWTMLYGGIIFAFAFGVLFIQPVAPADIFNSFLAGSFFLSIIAAVTLNNWISDKAAFIKIAFFILLISVTIPRWIYKTSIGNLYFKKTLPIIHSYELEAGKYLEHEPGTILVFNHGQWDSHFSYVSILARNNTFLSGQVIMSRHGVDLSVRSKIVESIEKSNNAVLVKTMLTENRISYLYFYGRYGLSVPAEKIDAKKVFSNGTIDIYKVGI